MLPQIRIITTLAVAVTMVLTVGPSNQAHAQTTPQTQGDTQVQTTAPEPAPSPVVLETPVKHAIYIELLGNGLVYSVNYDHKFGTDWSGRIGVGFAAGDSDWFGTMPILVNYLLGEGNTRLELGAGVLLGGGSDSGDSDSDVFGTLTVAYRKETANGTFFKAAFTPIFDGHGFLPWFGISFGYGLP